MHYCEVNETSRGLIFFSATTGIKSDRELHVARTTTNVYSSFYSPSALQIKSPKPPPPLNLDVSEK